MSKIIFVLIATAIALFAVARGGAQITELWPFTLFTSSAFSDLITLIGILWVLHFLNALSRGGLNQVFGLRPISMSGFGGIIGVFTNHFFHYWDRYVPLYHLLPNSLLLFSFGPFVAYEGSAIFWFVTAISALVSGLGTWLFGQLKNEVTPYVGAQGIYGGYAGFSLVYGLHKKSKFFAINDSCDATGSLNNLLQPSMECLDRTTSSILGQTSLIDSIERFGANLNLLRGSLETGAGKIFLLMLIAMGLLRVINQLLATWKKRFEALEKLQQQAEATQANPENAESPASPSKADMAFELFYRTLDRYNEQLFWGFWGGVAVSYIVMLS